MKKIYSLLLISFLINSSVFGQQSRKQKTQKKQFYSNQRLQEPIFKWITGNYLKHGIQFSIGPTYTFTSLKTAHDKFDLDTLDVPGTSLERFREVKSRIGVFAEVGMVHIARRPNKIIHYYDWGIGFKLYGGRETTQLDTYFGDTLGSTRFGEGKFYNGYLYGRFDMHNVFQMNPYLFLDNSLGVNVDYMLLPGEKGYEGAVFEYDQKFQGDFTVQLHYSLGLGIKPWADKGFFFIPSIEIPILTGYEWDGGSPQFNWFSSRYFPAHLRLKFVWLFKKPAGWCPPVETNEMDRQRANEYQNQ